MNLLRIIEVKVGDKVFPVKVTYRARMEYEAMTGTPMSDFEKRIAENTAVFFYCTAVAGARALGKEFEYAYDEFLDIIDDYYEEVVINFAKALEESKPDEDGGAKKKKKLLV